MTFGRSAALAVLAVFGIAGPGAASPESRAAAVVAASKRATGGAAWDAVQGCHEEGTRGGGAIAYTTRFSLMHYGLRIDSQRDGNTRSMGFDGKSAWQSMGGKTAVSADPDALREATLTDYLSINGFFFPDRFPATFRYLREASEAGDRFDVLEITPAGARPLEIWFDRRSHLIRRVVDTRGTPPATVEASDYRTVGGLTVAYKLITLGADGKIVDTGAVTSFQCGPIDDSIFDPPVAR